MSGPARDPKTAGTLRTRRLYFVWFTSHIGWHENPVLEGQPLEVCNWVLALFLIHLSYGNNIFCRDLKVGTLHQYILAAASLIAQYSSYKVDPRREGPTSSKLARCLDAVFRELMRYETVPNRREPLTIDMVEALRQRNIRAALPQFHKDVQLYHWFVVGLGIGPRRSEWCQASSSATSAPPLQKPDIDDRDGRPRAFMLDDFECFTASNQRLPLHDAVYLCPDMVDYITVKWRFQKNGENGEKKKLKRSSSPTAPHCRVQSLLAILRCRMSLVAPNAEVPVAIYQHASASPAVPAKYITNYDVTGMLRSLAAQVYNLNPNNPQDRLQLKRWSSHSVRVGACVLLHVMGFDSTTIKFLLRWKSDAFMSYLRNMSFLAQQHADALDRAAAIPNIL
jgi:hypothetical protein